MKYPFNVYFTQVEGHQFYIAECKILKGCVGQGDTIQEAIAELNLNEEEWLKTAKEYGISIPEIPLEMDSEFSGKFTVRVSPHVHKTATELAKKQGVSLNQYINDAIVSQNAAITTTDYIIPKVKEAVKKISMVMETSLTTKTSQNYNATNQYAMNKTTPSEIIYVI